MSRRYEEAVELAKARAETLLVGDPNDPGVFVGPMSSAGQKQSVLDYIQQAMSLTGHVWLQAGLKCAGRADNRKLRIAPTIFC